MSGQPPPAIPPVRREERELPAETSSDNAEEKILRSVTDAEIELIRSVLAGVKNRGEGWGEIVIQLKRGRIIKCQDKGEQIPKIYGEGR